MVDRARLRGITGETVAGVTPLAGGCVGDVQRVDGADGGRWVVKTGDRDSALDLEGWMLEVLAERGGLPVPRVLHAAPDLLVMEWLPGSTGARGPAEEHAAELLAALHDVTTDRFGLERDTLIGGLPLPNPWTRSWIAFYGEHRVVHMARLARDAGRLDRDTARRLEELAGRLERWLEEPPRPALLHGDVWSGNVLSARGRVTGFLDPAVHYGHPEVELAFITMFGTFGERFFSAYRERAGIAPGFEERRPLHLLHPLLVHTRLFGGSYAGEVRAIVGRYT